MVLQIASGSRIENPRQYDTHALEELRNLLTAGVKAQRDPIREFFYELEGIMDTYYIHVSPITGNVVLLARWSRQLQDCYQGAEHLVA
jgi:hypothetical protein